MKRINNESSKRRTKGQKVSIAVRPKPRSKSTSAASKAVSAYVDTLEDPWEHGPINMGYDCYVPTVLGSGYIRSSVIVNPTDGSFAITLAADVTAAVRTNVSGKFGTTWLSGAVSNMTALQAQGVQGRLVSGGLRVIALYPATSSPGVLGAGVIADTSPGGIVTLSPQSLMDSPSTEMGIAARGARATIRPLDNTCFEFQPVLLNGYASSSSFISSSCYVTGLGFPEKTVIWYEAILNLELLPQNGTGTIGIDASQSPQSTLSSFIPSIEGLMNSARSLLGNAAVMDATEGLLSVSGHPSAAFALKAARRVSGFSRGSHSRKLLGAGISEERKGQQNTVLMEESKDNSSRRYVYV